MAVEAKTINVRVRGPNGMATLSGKVLTAAVSWALHAGCLQPCTLIKACVLHVLYPLQGHVGCHARSLAFVQ
jgi:hypothetical protein